MRKTLPGAGSPLGISVFGAVGNAAACFLGVNLFRDIESSERPRQES